MSISIKNKIRSGTFFLFLLLIISGGFSIYFLLKLKDDSRNIIKANYESLDYSHKMQEELGKAAGNGFQPARFDSLLMRQEQNLTEKGEKEETDLLRKDFEKLKGGDTSALIYKDAEDKIQAIITLNMDAIQRKNSQAQKTAETATNVIVLLSAVIFLISLVFSVNFPAIVVTPIKKFSEAIREITARNYKHRIYLDHDDEFKQLGNAFNDMSERLEEFESSNLNKLIFEKSRAEAVINSLKDASIGIDKDNTVLFANRQALDLLGLSAGEVIGKSVNEISQKNDLFSFLITKEDAAPFKIVIDNKENYYVKEIIEVTQDEAKNKVIVLKNITSFKELDVAKTNFIATVSHELKTPLASSDLSIKLLEDSRVSSLTNEQKELVDQLKTDNRRMLKILSELLNLSQVEAGKIQLSLGPVNVNAIIDTSLAAVAASLREKKIIIKKEIQELPEIKADADKISWVINNFLTNAVKFSPEESKILVSSYIKDQSVFVEVKDEGPGIDPAFYDKIFERYFQIPRRSDKKGSGIGLAICKELILAMGGNIWVKSEPGQGSTFGFNLPSEK